MSTVYVASAFHWDRRMGIQLRVINKNLFMTIKFHHPVNMPVLMCNELNKCETVTAV